MIKVLNFSGISPIARDVGFLMSVGLMVIALVGVVAFLLIRS